MKIIHLLVGAMLGAVIIFNIPTHVAAADTYLKVTKNNFLKTTRQIKTYNSKKTISMTIPKNTVVQVAGVTTRNKKRYIDLNANQLNYKIRQPLIANNSTTKWTHWISTNTKNFKRVHKPTYLNFYAINKSYPKGAYRSYVADGNLWQTTVWPADPSTQSAALVQITANGYLEYSQSVNMTSLLAPKPTDSLQIQKATYSVNNGKLDLYFKTKPKFAETTRINKKGNNRYRLVIKRLFAYTATPITATNDPTNISKIEIGSRYQIGKTNYLMHLGTAEIKSKY